MEDLDEDSKECVWGGDCADCVGLQSQFMTKEKCFLHTVTFHITTTHS